ncbi:putative acetate kinase [Hypsizygus marmoreus]|uniref:Probable acetate kinase n=1 Tax=Hypsizygus marmoreus TaxID=39966 RepID=A0A369JYC4_HYPMA|nr:putative acetate kinase [Hypsizygus marmoreus]
MYYVIVWTPSSWIAHISRILLFVCKCCPRMSLILSVNAGSSSLKISLYRRTDSSDIPVKLILTSSISNISAPPATFAFNGTSEPVSETDITDHASAFAYFLSRLDGKDGENRTEIRHICHRVVHGGDFTTRVVIDDNSYNRIQSLSDLAPLHNGAALSVIKACIKNIPESTSIAYFDSAFHRSIPPHISTYAIDQAIATQRGLKKYGFHGLSYSFILRAVSRFLQKPSSSLNLIVLHLGSGASACAIQAGKSLDTSMGLTPLSGLPGATRSGIVDPSLIFHYTNKAGRMTHDPGMAINLHAEDILNRKSGWKSLTGTTDFRVITDRADLSSSSPATSLNGKPNPNRLAFDIFVDRILDYIGGYHLKLAGQVDALVFSGGIGERSKELRAVLGEKVKCLGYVDLDEEKNNNLGDGVVIDIGIETADGKRMLVCRTDEQVEMARACALDEEFWLGSE